MGIILVYAYILIVLFAVEKLWNGDKAAGRKILHICMGNIVFILWFFTHWWAAVLIAGSFVIFSLLITQHMQRYFSYKLAISDDKGKVLRSIYLKAITRLPLISTSNAGNEFGLVYYCLAYTLLAFLFFEDPVVIAVGMLSLAYGDGLGAIFGRRYGLHKYRIADLKSIEGTMAVLIGTTIAVFAGMVFYGLPVSDSIWKACVIGILIAIIEAVSPKGLDNLTIPFSAVALFHFIL